MASKNKISARDINLFYGQKQALFDINLDIKENSVTALIGPSGCGKSSFLRCINRMNDTIPICRIEGALLNNIIIIEIVYDLYDYNS